MAPQLGVDLAVLQDQGDQVAELADLGDLVGGVDGEAVAPGQPHAVAHVVLARLLVGDRGVVAHAGDEVAHRRPEALGQLGSLRGGVLEHVMQHRRGDDVIGIALAPQQRRHLDRMYEERRAVGKAPLTGMAGLREVQRSAGEWKLSREAQPGRGPDDTLHRPKCLVDDAARGCGDSRPERREHRVGRSAEVAHALQHRPRRVRRLEA